MRRQIVIMLLGLMTTLSLPAFAIAGSRENDHATQPYKYIGKELDRTHGLDWYDHGARHYDPVTGRWNVMDALAEKYYSWSPYVSCGDDPVNYIDARGDSAWAVRRQWSEEDSENFSNFVQLRTGEYNIADSAIIDSICKLYNSYSCEFIICTLGYTEGPHAYTSVVFVKNADATDYWCIARPKGMCTECCENKENNPYIKRHGNIESDELFSYKEKSLCGVTMKENCLYFVPPLFFEKLIVYKKNSSTFYFEMGISPKSYSPSQKRERYRREWEAIIIKYINKVCL